MKTLTLSILSLIFSLSLQAQEPIVIGWSGPLTGNCAVVGVDSVAATQLVIDKVNKEGGIAGRPLKLVIEDDAYATSKAVTAYRKLVHQDNALVILANTYGGVFATAKDAVKDDVLVIDPLDCNEKLAALPENTLCLATKTESISSAFSSHIVKNKASAVLILIEESDGWMQLIADNTRKDLEKAGVLVIEDSYPATTSSYKSSLIRAKHAGVTSVIILGNDQMGSAVREMNELDFKAQIYGVGSISSPGFQALAGKKNLEGALVSSWGARKNQAYSEFMSTFESRFNRKPVLELATLPSYDAVGFTVSCLKKLSASGTEINAGNLRECFLSGKKFQGLTGDIHFDSDGAVRSIHEELFQLKGGELEKL